MDQPGKKVANPARGQLSRENSIPLFPCVPQNLVSRDGFSRPVPRQPAHLHPQAESGAYLRDSSRVSRRRPFMKPPYAIGSVPSLWGHAIAYTDGVHCRESAGTGPVNLKVVPNGCCLAWQITMDQLIFASLSHTHYWHEVGMLKVPAVLTSGFLPDILLFTRKPLFLYGSMVISIILLTMYYSQCLCWVMIGGSAW